MELNENLPDQSIAICDKFEHLPQIKALRDLINKSNGGSSSRNNNNKASFTNELLNEYKAQLKSNSSNLNDTNVEFEFVIENQRGMKFFGIPLFSTKSLIPLFDPPSFQLLSGKFLLEAVENGNHMESVHTSLANLYPLPDLNWEWTWENWYVFMLHDVDDQGWIYLSFWFGSKHWKGKYYFGNFIRRRIWIRLRNRIGYKVAGYQNDHISSLMGNDLDVGDECSDYELGDTIYVGS